MTSIDLLVAEHRVIEKVLDAFQEAARRYAAGGECDDVSAMLRFFQTYGDAAHHEKEEQVLFPALRRHGIEPDASVLGPLSAQHASCRALVRDLHRYLDEPDSERARRAFAATTDEYAAMLRLHIALEDAFFAEVVQDEVLSPQEDDALVDAMLARDEEAFREVAKAAFERSAAAWRGRHG